LFEFRGFVLSWLIRLVFVFSWLYATGHGHSKRFATITRKHENFIVRVSWFRAFVADPVGFRGFVAVRHRLRTLETLLPRTREDTKIPLLQFRGFVLSRLIRLIEARRAPGAGS
jgi:hypothetical protein